MLAWPLMDWQASTIGVDQDMVMRRREVRVILSADCGKGAVFPGDQDACLASSAHDAGLASGGRRGSHQRCGSGHGDSICVCVYICIFKFHFKVKLKRKVHL